MRPGALVEAKKGGRPVQSSESVQWRNFQGDLKAVHRGVKRRQRSNGATERGGGVGLISLPFEAHAAAVDSANCIAITENHGILAAAGGGDLNDVGVLGQVFN